MTEAARRLIDAARNPGDTAAIQNALMLNQRLWTIFQASLIDPECPLPAEIRENMLVLSVVVDKQTTLRLADLDVTQFGRLININRAIASGLSQRPQGAATAQQSAAAPPAPSTSPHHPAGAAPGDRARPAVKISI